MSLVFARQRLARLERTLKGDNKPRTALSGWWRVWGLVTRVELECASKIMSGTVLLDNCCQGPGVADQRGSTRATVIRAECPPKRPRIPPPASAEADRWRRARWRQQGCGNMGNRAVKLWSRFWPTYSRNESAVDQISLCQHSHIAPSTRRPLVARPPRGNRRILEH